MIEILCLIEKRNLLFLQIAKHQRRSINTEVGQPCSLLGTQ